MNESINDKNKELKKNWKKMRWSLSMDVNFCMFICFFLTKISNKINATFSQTSHENNILMS